MKKTVNFVGTPEFFKYPLRPLIDDDLLQYADEERRVILAMVNATNHPRLGRQRVRTSVVVKCYKNGNFDTLNTKYKKVLDNI